MGRENAMDEQLFHTSLHMIGGLVAQIKPEDMDKPTPCTEWDVRTLLNHIMNEVAWVEPLLQGKTIADVGTALDGDLIGSDACASWSRLCESASNAVDATPGDKITHLSYADKTAKDYVNEVGADVVVHGWDLAQAIGARYIIDDKLAFAVFEATNEIMPMARKAGLIKELPEAGEDADAEERLLAHFGRSKNWK